jgi:hypothetical protein
MTDTVHVKILVQVGHEQWTFAEVDLPETGQFSMLAPTFRRLADEMDAEAAARASAASVAPLTEETEND